MGGGGGGGGGGGPRDSVTFAVSFIYSDGSIHVVRVLRGKPNMCSKHGQAAKCLVL